MSRVLVVGQGAREHALGYGLSGAMLFFAPGNAGTASIGTNVPVAADDVPALVALARRERIDLVVVGPEAPLVGGLVDALAASGITAFGPSAAAARLEGSKVFMKELARRAGLPTAAYEVFDDVGAARRHVEHANRPLVVKADGLCAGKGVTVAMTTAEAIDAVDECLERRAFGEAGSRVVIEEILRGAEASFHVVTDGERVLALPVAQDHKRIFDGDRGPNTGGMGAYAPAPLVDERIAAQVLERIVAPTLATMAREGAPFRGVLFVGLMIDEGRASLLEFNVRFGDPETTVLVPLLEGSWLELLEGAARGELSRVDASVRSGAALSVVLASEGYPATPTKGDEILGLDDAGRVPGAHLFHAGTAREGDRVVTAGGRVLVATGVAPSLADAHRAAYLAADAVTFRGRQLRRDIGARALGAASTA